MTVITTANLRQHSKADLTSMAKRLGVTGYSSMRKEQLVAAVAKASGSKNGASSARKGGSKTSEDSKRGVNGSARRGGGRGVKSSASSASSEKSSPRKRSTSKSTASEATRTAAGSKNGKATGAAGSRKGSRSDSGGGGRPKVAGSGSSKTAASSRSKNQPSGRSIKAESKKSSSKVSGKDQKSKANTASPNAKSKSGKTDGHVKSRSEAKHSARKMAAGKAGKPSAKKSDAKKSTTSPKVLKRIRELQVQREAIKDLSFQPTLINPPHSGQPTWEKEPERDRIALLVRDPFWLHATWDVTRGAIERAKAAMAEQWHSARPTLRLLRVDDSGTSSTSEMVERDIEIHGGLRNWYIDWNGEAARLRILIGYLAPGERFHTLAKSNIVRMPKAGSNEAIDNHWSDAAAESEHIFAMSGGYDAEQETGELKEVLEDRVQKTLGAPPLARIGCSPDAAFRKNRDFHFDMEIELVVYGSTLPDGYVTLSGEPVTLRSDGSFVVRLPFPDRRQVLPAVACSRDGSQQRTIVVAVERNTKVMEPLEKDLDAIE